MQIHPKFEYFSGEVYYNLFIFNLLFINQHSKNYIKSFSLKFYKHLLMELLYNNVREDDKTYDLIICFNSLGRFILNYFQNLVFFGKIGKGLAYEY